MMAGKTTLTALVAALCTGLALPLAVAGSQ